MPSAAAVVRSFPTAPSWAFSAALQVASQRTSCKPPRMRPELPGGQPLLLGTTEETHLSPLPAPLLDLGWARLLPLAAWTGAGEGPPTAGGPGEELGLPSKGSFSATVLGHSCSQRLVDGAACFGGAASGVEVVMGGDCPTTWGRLGQRQAAAGQACGGDCLVICPSPAPVCCSLRVKGFL